jgi:hypothetical protein
MALNCLVHRHDTAQSDIDMALHSLVQWYVTVQSDKNIWHCTLWYTDMALHSLVQWYGTVRSDKNIWHCTVRYTDMVLHSVVQRYGTAKSGTKIWHCTAWYTDMALYSLVQRHGNAQSDTKIWHCAVWYKDIALNCLVQTWHCTVWYKYMAMHCLVQRHGNALSGTKIWHTAWHQTNEAHNMKYSDIQEVTSKYLHPLLCEMRMWTWVTGPSRYHQHDTSCCCIVSRLRRQWQPSAPHLGNFCCLVVPSLPYGKKRFVWQNGYMLQQDFILHIKTMTHMSSRTVWVRSTRCEASQHSWIPPSYSSTAVTYPGHTSNLTTRIVFIALVTNK